MEKLIILDYTTAIVDVYDVDSEADINETYLHNLGYNTNNCEWMFSENIEITFHKGVLK